MKTSQLPSNTIISVILVTYNNQNIIKSYIKEVEQVLEKYSNFEIIIVDNASTDNSVNKIKEAQSTYSQIRLLVMSKTYSSEMALTAGLDSCIGDYVFGLNLITDSPTMVSHILPRLIGGKDLVFLRFKNYNFLTSNTLTRWFSAILAKLYNRNIFSNICYSIALTRKAVNALTKIRRKKRYYEYISKSIGFDSEVFHYKPRKKYLKHLRQESVSSIFLRVLDASISHSVRPLRLVSFVGIIASILNLFFLLYVFIITLVKQNITEGWITTSVMIGSMFFLLFLMLSIMSEYLLRILEESRQEPLYFIAEEIDNSDFDVKRTKLNVV